MAIGEENWFLSVLYQFYFDASAERVLVIPHIVKVEYGIWGNEMMETEFKSGSGLCL